MAKLSSLKMVKNEDNRIIKCLVVEDFKTGNVYKIYNSNKFEDIIQKTDEMFLTKVFAPTTDEREGIFNLIAENVSEDGKVEISDYDMLTIMFSKFTDLEIDLDEDGIKDVLDSPSEFLIQIKSELDKLLIGSIESFMEFQQTLESSPRVSQVLSETINTKNNLMAEKENERQKEIELRQQEADELMKQAEEMLNRAKELKNIG